MQNPVYTIKAFFCTEGSGIQLTEQDDHRNLDRKHANLPPIIPARFLEGAWTRFVIETGLSGDNGVYFHAPTAILQQQSFVPGIQINRKGGPNQLFTNHVIQGVFELHVDVFEQAKLLPLLNFLDKLDEGVYLLGAGRTVGYGQVKFGFILPASRKAFRVDLHPSGLAFASDEELQSLRDHFGAVDGVGTDQLADAPGEFLIGGSQLFNGVVEYVHLATGSRVYYWVEELVGTDPLLDWQAIFSRHILAGGNPLDLVSSEEYLNHTFVKPHPISQSAGVLELNHTTALMGDWVEIVERHLGISVSSNWAVTNYPDAGMVTSNPVLRLLPVDKTVLVNLNLPYMPWSFESCADWRARLDILFGLIVVFMAQPGVGIFDAATCAYAIYFALTKFEITEQNAGGICKAIDNYKLQIVLEKANRVVRIAHMMSQGTVAMNYQQVARYIIKQFPEIAYTPSEHYFPVDIDGVLNFFDS